MYNFDKDIIQAISKKTILQTCFAENTLVFSLDEDSSISIYSNVYWRINGGSINKWEINNEEFRDLSFISFIGHQIERVDLAPGNSELVLTLLNGNQLILRNDSEHFECMQINLGGKEFYI